MFKATKKFWSVADALDDAASGGGGGPVNIFTANPALNADDPGNVGTTFRVVCTITAAATGSIKVSIQPGTVQALTVTNVGIGKWSGAYSDVTAPIIEALFAGASGFANKTTLQQSDAVNVSALGLVNGDKIVVTYITGASTQCSLRLHSAATNAETWWQTGSHWNVQSPGAINGLLTSNYAIASVDTV
jgi:hypothetical protein